MIVEINGEKFELGLSSSWNGYEISYPEILVVGLYIHENLNVYIDTENNRVLEYWYDDENGL